MSDDVESAIAILARLVGFNTISRESNLELIDWVEDFVRPLGARCRRTWNEQGSKANLFVAIGPDAPGGVVLSGHSDVVPVEGQDWHSDPFVLTERDGRLYGRGSSDMKGFTAACLAVLGRVDLRRLQKPIYLALSYDEEVGCLGVDRMVDDALEHFPRPDYAIIGEPTSMQVVRAHKSINVFRTVVTGKPAHSSQPHRGAGAIFAAARIIDELRRLGDKRRALGSDSGCEPPWTTVQVGRIDGGTALNILPGRCEFLWEYRALPHEDPEALGVELNQFIEREVVPDLREFAPQAAVDTKTIARVPPLMPDPKARAEGWLGALPGVRPGGSGEVSFVTEAGSFQRAGISTVVCGPGSIDQAHQPNEFIEPAELGRCVRMITAIVDRLAAST